MSPEEAFAGEEVVALERRTYVIPRDGATGPELFIRIGRDSHVIPLGIGTVTQLAEYMTGYMARTMRRALVEEANGG